jgi:hypothetical protein
MFDVAIQGQFCRIKNFSVTDLKTQKEVVLA